MLGKGDTFGIDGSFGSQKKLSIIQNFTFYIIFVNGKKSRLKATNKDVNLQINSV